jgi:hypothetical protein
LTVTETATSGHVILQPCPSRHGISELRREAIRSPYSQLSTGYGPMLQFFGVPPAGHQPAPSSLREAENAPFRGVRGFR